MKDTLNFKVIITQDEDGVFVASCPAIPGCHTQGDTYEEAEKNIPQLKIVTLGVFASNLLAKQIYEKFGFKEYGRLPRGRYGL